MKFLPLKWVALLCLSGGLAQNSTPPAQPVGDCDNAVTTAAMHACEGKRYEAAQRELNSAYQALMGHLDAARKEKLRVAQRAWLRYRDANADFQASLTEGGTLAPLLKIGSLTEMTKARTAELKKEMTP